MKKLLIVVLSVLGIISIGLGASYDPQSFYETSTESSPTTETTVPSTTQVESATIATPTPTPTPTKSEPIEQNTPKASDEGLSNDNYYINSYGESVHSPAYSDTVPEGATAQCGDGTYSFSQSRRGTCSHHGGVASWLY